MNDFQAHVMENGVEIQKKACLNGKGKQIHPFLANARAQVVIFLLSNNQD
ncbi:MAG: hypothetical protein ACTSVI_02240 [Promethearchaeota archaeon]